MSKTVIIDGKRYTVPDDATLEEIEALLASSAVKPMTEAETVQDIAAGASRGMAPYAAGAALGAGAGALFGGVGAAPGAAAGVAAVGAAQFIGDPLVDSVNSLFGTRFTKPTEALNQLMDMAGLAKPESQAGQMAEKVAAGVSGGIAGVGAARSVAAGAAPGSLTQGVAQTMAAAPVSQIVAGGTGAAGAELARQSGLGPIEQTIAGLGAGLGGGLATNMAGNFGSRIGMQLPPRSDMPMLEQGFDNTTNMTVRVPMQQPRAPLPMTYEDVARDARTAATGGLGSKLAEERLARAAPLNKDAAAAAERLGIDVPPDVLMDHTQLKEAVGLTRSMPGTVASAAWSDAVERAATQADEAMALIDGSPDLSEISDSVLASMNKTQAELQKQADEIYGRVNAKLKPAAQAAEAAAPDVAALKQQGFDVDTKLYHGTAADFETFDASKLGANDPLARDAKEAFFFTTSPEIATQYADEAARVAAQRKVYATPEGRAQLKNPTREGAERVGKMIEAEIKGAKAVPVNFRLRNPKIITTIKEYDPDTDEVANAIAQAKAEGHDGVIFKGMSDALRGNKIVADTYAIFDPANIVRADRPTGAAAAPKPSASVDLVNSRRLLNSVVKDLGNDVSKLTPLEKELREMSSPGRELPVTYTALMRMKADVGQALQRSAGPYKDVDSAILKRLYGALSEDQLAHAQKIGGDTLRADLRLGNQLVAKRKALEDRIVSLFGDERDGSIARKLVSTLQGGAKGDITGFNRLVKSIPQDLRKKAVASAIAAAAREEKTNGFGFSKYVNLYQGLRRNSEVYKTVVQTLGPDSDKFMRDLYEVSKRITEARANVKTTGQANQALVQGLMAEGLVEGVMKSSLGRQTVMGAATAAGGVMAGPVAGAASAMLANSLSQARKSTLNAAGDLFASPEWQQLVINVSTKQQVNQKIYNAAKNSGAFKKWAREAGITDPDQWLRSTISSTIGMGAAEKTQPFQAGMGRPE
jgi:hypothetical protein